LLKALGQVRREMTAVTEVLKENIGGLQVASEIIAPRDALEMRYVFSLTNKEAEQKHCVVSIRPSSLEGGRIFLNGPDHHSTFYDFGKYGDGLTEHTNHPAKIVARWVAEKMTRAMRGELVT
jgi:hypothetical protein